MSSSHFTLDQTCTYWYQYPISPQNELFNIILILRYIYGKNIVWKLISFRLLGHFYVLLHVFLNLFLYNEFFCELMWHIEPHIKYSQYRVHFHKGVTFFGGHVHVCSKWIMRVEAIRVRTVEGIRVNTKKIYVLRGLKATYSINVWSFEERNSFSSTYPCLLPFYNILLGCKSRPIKRNLR